MLFYGADLSLTGAHAEPGAGVNNVNLLRTLESFYGLDASGDQSVLATAAGMSNNGITDIFAVPEPSSLPLVVLGCLLPILLMLRRRNSTIPARVAASRTERPV